MNNKFFDSLNTAVFTTKYVLKGGSPVLYVYHNEEDGAWEFFGMESITEENARIISLEEIINIDNSILQLADMPLGYYAHRENNKSKWIIQQI